MASLFGFIIGSVVTYLLTTLILFLPGWLLTRRLSKNLRVLLRAGVMAIAFAPGMFISPGGEFGIIAPTVLIVIYYWSDASFWIELAVAPMLITFTICLMFMLWLDKGKKQSLKK